MCRKHKEDDTINMKAPKCSIRGCYKAPSRGYEIYKKTKYCENHATEDMVIIRKECATEGCKVTPNYGFERSRTHCVTHKQPWMCKPITVARKRDSTAPRVSAVTLLGVAAAARAVAMSAEEEVWQIVAQLTDKVSAKGAAAGKEGMGKGPRLSPALAVDTTAAASSAAGEGEECKGGGGGQEPGSVVDDTVPSFTAAGGEGGERQEVRKTMTQRAGALVEGEGEGEPPESAVNTAAAAAGEVGEAEWMAPESAAALMAPQGVGGNSSTGAAASGGGSGGESGSGSESGGGDQHEEYAVPVAKADSDDDGAAVVTPGRGTDPEQPVPASGERGTVEVEAIGEGCTAPPTAATGEKGSQTPPPQGGRCVSSSGGGGGGGSGGGESGAAIDAAILVSAAGAAGAGGVDMASTSNLNLLATACPLEENGSCGGIESGGGDAARHEETVPIEDGAPDLSQELVATHVNGTQPVVESDVTVQAAGEAGAVDMMPTSIESAGVAQWPGSSSSRSRSGGGSKSGSGSGSGSENGGGAEHEEDAIPVPRRSSRVVGSSALESPSVVRLLA